MRDRTNFPRLAAGVLLLLGFGSGFTAVSLKAGDQSAFFSPKADGRKALEAKLAGRYDQAFDILSRRFQADPSAPEADLCLRMIDSFEDGLADRGRYAEFLVDASRTSEFASLLLRSIWFQKGDLAAMAGQSARLNIVTNFLAAAPFANEDGRGHESVYPPEQELSFSDTYAGKVRPIGWRPVFTNPYGRLKADNFFRPYQEATGYFCVFLRSETEQSGFVKLAINTPFKLWMNRVPVADDGSKHPFVADQYTLPVTLRAGWNLLLLKSSVPDQDEWKFLLRLSGFSPGVEQSTDPALLGQIPSPGLQAGEAPVSQGSAEGTNTAEGLFGYAYRRYLLQDYDRNENIAGRLFQRLSDANRDPLYAFMAGVSHGQYRFQRKYLEASLDLAPDLVEPAVQLVNYYYNLNRPDTMFDAVGRIAPAARPWALSLFLCRYHLGRSEPLKALQLMNGLAHRETVSYWSAKAALADELLSSREAVSNYEHAYRLDRTDGESRDRLVDAYCRSGDRDAALTLLDGVFALFPDSIEILEKKAAILSGLGDFAAASAELGRAATICPEDAYLLERLGDLWSAMSVRSNVRKYYRAALEVKPNNNRLKDHLAFLFPSTNVLTHFSKPVEEVWKRGESASETTILLNQEVSEVYRDGTSSTLTHSIVKLQSESDLDEFKEQNLFYNPDQERINLLKARVYDRSMAYREIDDVSDYAYGGENASLFYNLRYRHIVFPKLEKGAVVELEYIRYNFGANELGADYFGASFNLQDRFPVLLNLFTVVAEDGVKIYTGYENLDRPETVAVTSGKWRNRNVTTWSATNTPKIWQEMWAPPAASLAPGIVVSTMKDWKEFGTWLSALYKDQLVADETLRQTVLVLTEGATSVREKVRRIWEYCAAQVRYVGLELGIGGIRPRPVGTVLSSGFGDCKDKASLLSVMLGEIGVKAGIALVRTSGKGRSSYPVPFVGAFDHAICWVNNPAGGEFLDGTADLFTYGVLPYQDRVEKVLLLDGGQTRFLKVPADTSGANRNVTRSTVTIRTGGSAFLTRSVAKTGNLSPRFRYDFYAEDKRRQKLEEYWGQWFQGAAVTAMEFNGLSDLSVEPDGNYTVELPQFTEEQNGHPYFKAVLGRSDYILQYAPDSRPRHYDLELPFPFELEDETVFTLPAGFGWDRVPSVVKEGNDLVSVERTVRQDGALLTVRLTIVFKVRVVPRGRYPEFRALMNRLNSLQDEKIFFHGARR